MLEPNLFLVPDGVELALLEIEIWIILAIRVTFAIATFLYSGKVSDPAALC